MSIDHYFRPHTSFEKLNLKPSLDVQKESTLINLDLAASVDVSERSLLQSIAVSGETSMSVNDFESVNLDIEVDGKAVDPGIMRTLPLENAIDCLPETFHNLLKEYFRIQFTHVEPSH